MREKSEWERESGGYWRVLAGREGERKRERGIANRANGEKGRERKLEGSNRTSKLNVEIRVECLAR